MPELAENIRILDLLRDILFIEDVDFYPRNMWEDFEDAISMFLNDEEIAVINYRYGEDDFCEFQVGERRRILLDLSARLRESRLFDEMNSLMAHYENSFSLPVSTMGGAGDLAFSLETQEFVRRCLSMHGLPYDPGVAGDFSFDSRIGEYPVIVWRFSECEMKLEMLKDLLKRAAESGFRRLILLAMPRLTLSIPKEIEGHIPYTFLPVIEKGSSAGTPASRGQ
ncbi:MAG TPA: hypothetical protein VMM38_03025 [Aridibacter sp.]|nr:hypothetical protein [Aridibacter sp.]